MERQVSGRNFWRLSFLQYFVLLMKLSFGYSSTTFQHANESKHYICQKSRQLVKCRYWGGGGRRRRRCVCTVDTTTRKVHDVICSAWGSCSANDVLWSPPNFNSSFSVQWIFNHSWKLMKDEIYDQIQALWTDRNREGSIYPVDATYQQLPPFRWNYPLLILLMRSHDNDGQIK